MSNDITVETFLKQKIINFILFLEKTIGKNNRLYSQVIQLQSNTSAVVSYAGYLVSVAKKKDNVYYFEDETIKEYLKNNEIGGDAVNQEFVTKLRRYLELFVKTCA